eukprot:SAG11_NODE_1586_length_4636_cov_9.336125_1_plen_44_part_00
MRTATLVAVRAATDLQSKGAVSQITTPWTSKMSTFIVVLKLLG